MIKRRNYLIKKDVQMGFVYRFLALLLVELALIAFLFNYVSTNTITSGYIDSVLKVQTTPAFFLVQVFLIMLVVGVGMGLAGMVVFVMLSHRIAGPIYRIEQDLESVKSGDLTKRISIRSTDRMTELKDSLNDLVGGLDARVSRIHTGLSELKSMAARKDEPGNADKILKAIEALNNEINFFKVTSGPKE